MSVLFLENSTSPIAFLGILRCLAYQHQVSPKQLVPGPLYYKSLIQLSGKLTQVPEIARYYGEIYGNISKNGGINRGASPRDPPKK